MITYQIFQRIKSLYEQEGLSLAQIANELELHRRTVKYWVGQKHFLPRKYSPRPSKLDPYKPEIKRLLAKHPYTGQQIFQKLREAGYTGGSTILLDYLQTVRPPPPKNAYLTLTFAPGEAAQVDWGEFGTIQVGSTKRRLSFFLMVLCHSRALYLEFTVCQTMEHFLACHQNAFDFFQMVPRKIIVDNLKSAVLRRLVGKAPVFNSRYLDFARHHGFEIVACNVRAAHEKGRVENGVGYVKKNLLAGLELPDFGAMSLVANSWRDSIANVRNHGETKQRPVDLLPQDRSAALPLPENRYDVAVIHSLRATKRFRIHFEANRYSVPCQYAGERLTVKAYPERLAIYHDQKLIALHSRSYDRNCDYENPDHVRDLLSIRKNARAQKLLERFLQISPLAADYYRELNLRNLNVKNHVEKILALAEIHGKDAVNRAMADAQHFNAYSAEYIQNIIFAYSTFMEQPQPLALTRNADLLELELPEPDLTLYEKQQGVQHENETSTGDEPAES